MARHERVEIDQVGDPVSGAVCNTRGDHTAVAVPDQDHVTQVLKFQYVQDIGDVGVEVDARMRQVRALTNAGVGGRDECVA